MENVSQKLLPAERATSDAVALELVRHDATAQLAVERKKVFIVHGRNHALRDKIQLFLVVDLGLETEVMEAGANAGRTMPEKFEESARGCAFAVCILSADDDLTEHGAVIDESGGRVRMSSLSSATSGVRSAGESELRCS